MQALTILFAKTFRIPKKLLQIPKKPQLFKYLFMPQKNKFNIFISLMLLFVIAIPTSLSACSTPELGFGEIVISEDAEKNTNEPVNPKSEFDISAKQIFATIKYTGVTGDHNWRFKWIYAKTGEIVLDAGKKYNEAQPQGYFQGIMASNIYITDETKKIPAGKYKISFYHNGELKKSADFIVNEPKMKIIEAFTSKEIDERGNPLEPVLQFKTTDSVYANIKTDYLVAGHTLKAAWKKGDDSIIKEESAEIKDNYYEESYIGFKLDLSKGEKAGKPLPPGNYRVEIYLDDKKYSTLDFEVVKEDPVSFKKGATYTNEEFSFTISIPDDWSYTENTENNMLSLTLKPAVLMAAAFGFVAAPSEPLKPFADFAKKNAENLARENKWALIDSTSRDYNIKNGTPTSEIMYLYQDTEEVQYIIAYSFTEYNGIAYILNVAIDKDIYGDMALSVYTGILDSLVFKAANAETQ